MKIILHYCLLFIAIPSMAQQTKVQLALEHVVGKEALQLGNTYSNEFDEPFTPKIFKYYITNIGLTDDSGRFFNATNNYYLIDESQPESKRIAFVLPAGKYSKLRFTIGVDSATTVSGVQEGVLDPYQGMFWTWNTGYISLKLEGASAVSKMPQQMFQFDIGGFRVNQNSIRIIEIPFTAATSFKADEKTLISIQADIQKLFSVKNPLKIKQHSFIHNPGKEAMNVADNYAAMFSLLNLKRY